MRKRRLVVALAVAGVVVAGTFVAMLLRPSRDSSPLLGEKLTLISAAQRKALPDLRGPALTPPPTSISLARLRGRPAFVDVWASWCVPCRDEAPLLARLWREYRRDIRFLGIDVQDTRADARRFIRRFGLGYPNMFDRKAATSGKLRFFGLPTAYLVDRQGRVAAMIVGRKKEAPLRAALDALVGKADTAR